MKLVTIILWGFVFCMMWFCPPRFNSLYSKLSIPWENCQQMVPHKQAFLYANDPWISDKLPVKGKPFFDILSIFIFPLLHCPLVFIIKWQYKWFLFEMSYIQYRNINRALQGITSLVKGLFYYLEPQKIIDDKLRPFTLWFGTWVWIHTTTTLLI